MTFNYNVPGAVALFFGGSIGDQLTVFVEVNGFGGNSTFDTDDDLAGKSVSVDSPAINANVRVVWEFNPGFNFASVTTSAMHHGMVYQLAVSLTSPVCFLHQEPMLS